MKNFNIIFLTVSLIAGIWIFHSPNKLASPSPEETGRSEWRAMMRGGTLLATQQLEKAMSYFTKKQKLEKDGGIAYWDELGPRDRSGRVRSIAFHPNEPSTIFIGAVSGGIWKTTDGGNNWTAVNDLLPNLSITSIIIHPSQPDTMYVATGEGITGDIPGDGIYRSYDGGNAWVKIPGTTFLSNQFIWVNKIKFDPSDPSIVWAGIGNTKDPNSTGAKLYKIQNNGDATAVEEIGVWQQGLGNAVTNFWFAPNGDMFASILSRSRINASGFCLPTTGGLAKNSNGSNFWTTINSTSGFDPNPNRVELAIAPTDPGIIYALCQGKYCPRGLVDCSFSTPCNDGSSGELYKSTNGGITWINMNLSSPVFETGSGNNQGAYDNTIWIDPTNEDIVFIGGVDTWGSDDGGASFIQTSDWTDFRNGTSAHADHHVLIEASNFSSMNKNLYSASDGGLALYSLQHDQWTILNGHNMGTIQFYNADVSGGKVIGGAQDNGVFLTTNNGTSWSQLIGGDGGYCGFGGGNRLYFSTQNGHFRRSLDNGTTFSPILGLNNEIPTGPLDFTCPPTIIDEKPAFIAPLAVEYVSGTDHLFACSNSIWYSSENGCSWTQQLPHPVDLFKTYTAIETYLLNNVIQILVGDEEGGVWRAPVSGGTWTWTEVIAPGSIHDRVVTDIAVSPHDPNDIIVTFGGTIDDNVYLTTNFTNGWTEISSDIPALQINTVEWNEYDENLIYVGTDIGIMASDDRGQSWNVYPLYDGSEGPVFTEVTNLKFEDRLFASTYGRGTWRSNYAHKNLYVDQTDQGSLQIGSLDNPFVFFSKAVQESGNGSTINFISEGQHNQINSTLLIENKRVTFKALNQTVVVE